MWATSGLSFPLSTLHKNGQSFRLTLLVALFSNRLSPSFKGGQSFRLTPLIRFPFNPILLTCFKNGQSFRLYFFLRFKFLHRLRAVSHSGSPFLLLSSPFSIFSLVKGGQSFRLIPFFILFSLILSTVSRTVSHSGSPFLYLTLLFGFLPRSALSVTFYFRILFIKIRLSQSFRLT